MKKLISDQSKLCGLLGIFFLVQGFGRLTDFVYPIVSHLSAILCFFISAFGFRLFIRFPIAEYTKDHEESCENFKKKTKPNDG